MVKKHLAAITWFLAIAAIMTFPLILEPCSRLIGNNHSDSWQTIWNNWRVERSLLEGKPFMQTDMIYFPTGASLGANGIDFVSAFAAFILHSLFGAGPILSYNLTILAAFALNGVAIYFLGMKFKFDRALSIALGTVFMTSPYILSQVQAGGAGTMGLGTAVFAIGYCISFFEGGRPVDGLLFAVFFIMTLLQQLYFAMYLAIIAGITALFCIFPFRKDGSSTAVKASLAAAGVISALAVIFGRQVFDLHPFAALKPVKTVAANSLKSMLLPGIFLKEPAFFFHYTYISKILIAVAAVCAVAYRRVRPIALLSAIAILFLLLSFDGRTNLYCFFYYYVPYFNLIRFPDRFIAITEICLLMLAGYYFANSRAMHRRTAYLLAAAFIAAENLFAAYPCWPFSFVDEKVPPFYYSIKDEKGDFGILDIPVYGHKVIYYQTIHGKKIVGGYISYLKPSINLSLGADKDINLLFSDLEDRPMIESGIPVTEKDFGRYNIRYAVIHRDLIPKEHFDRLKADFGNFFKPCYEDDTIIAFDLSGGSGK